jgi:hypothetical protein
MVFGRVPEHEEFYRSEQNIIERLAAGISSTDDFLRLTNILLARQNQLIQALTGGGDGGGGGTVIIPKLGIRAVQLIKNVALSDVDTIVNPAEMADCRAANRVIIQISNTLNQQVRATVIGNIASGYFGADIMYEFLCPAGKSRSYGLKLEEWRPYVGVQVQALVAPTAGNLNAVAIIQE